VLPPIQRLLRDLSAADVRFIVVGGVAVVLHGFLRVTADLDLVLDLDSENLRKAVDVFEREGFQPRPPVPLRAFCDAEQRQRWKDEKNLLVFSLWHPRQAGFEVDLFVDEPFPFDAAYDRARLVASGDQTIRIASIDDLINMKRVAGRPKDAEDIEALTELRKKNEQREG
jgi:hypothetical protein